MISIPEEFELCILATKFENLNFIIHLLLAALNKTLEILQVTGVEALKAFSPHFLTPYQPLCSKDPVERLKRRISTLKQQLSEAEAELGKLEAEA